MKFLIDGKKLSLDIKYDRRLRRFTTAIGKHRENFDNPKNNERKEFKLFPIIDGHYYKIDVRVDWLLFQFHVQSLDGVPYFDLPYLISKLEEDDQNELEPTFKGHI